MYKTANNSNKTGKGVNTSKTSRRGNRIKLLRKAKKNPAMVRLVTIVRDARKMIEVRLVRR